MRFYSFLNKYLHNFFLQENQNFAIREVSLLVKEIQ